MGSKHLHAAFRAAVMVLAASICLGGCANWRPALPLAPEPDIPEGWSAGDARMTPTALAGWWRHFDDELLSRLVVDALQANTDVRAAQAALRQARALRDVAAAGLRPTLDSAASAQRNFAEHGTGNAFHAGLDAGWELDIFGARRSALDGADATAGARLAGLGDVQRSVAAEVALAYIALRGGQARLAIAQENLTSQSQTLRLTEWRVQAGLLSALESDQARSAVAQLRALQPALLHSIEQSAMALAVLTGRPPAALSSLRDVPGAVPQAPAELALAFPADTLRQRPDVRAAEQQVRAAQAQVAQADAARYPSLRLGGSLGLNALTVGGLGSGAALAGSLIGSIAWPVFDGGAAKAQSQAQRAALDQSRAVYRGTVLAALEEVEDALVALRSDRERVARLNEAAEAAANAGLLARQRFVSGLVDFQTVLDTQRNQLATQDGLAGAGADVSADHVRLFKALGGGWRSDLADRPDPDSKPGLEPR
jgi:NodT family efflux transporter outer membrane factor (OMF) lipoprotein